MRRRQRIRRNDAIPGGAADSPFSLILVSLATTTMLIIVIILLLVVSLPRAACAFQQRHQQQLPTFRRGGGSPLGLGGHPAAPRVNGLSTRSRRAAPFFVTSSTDLPPAGKEAGAEEEDSTVVARHRKRDMLPRAVQLYADYAGRLWNETNPEARERLAADRVVVLVHNLQSLLREDDVMAASKTSKEERQNVIDACDKFLKSSEAAKARAAKAAAAKDLSSPPLPPTPLESIGEDENLGLFDESSATSSGSKAVAMTASDDENSSAKRPAEKKEKKKRRSIWFGAAMGFVVACWVFSGNYIFTGLFTLMTVLGQLEYYRMVINTGVYPARRISVVGACSMFLTALFTPDLHQICLPMFGLWSMVWFLTMKRSVTTIPEIATTFTGMFYLGYVPSFWVRIRLINSGRELTRLAPLAGPFLARITGWLRQWVPESAVQAVHLPITTGAIFIFWTWLCLAFSDVGAYFVGKSFGKTKLGKIAPAAGATSPNKTVEGVLGGCAVSAALSVLGAWVQKWPYWFVTGAVHGLLLGLLGLVGDLTASMLKRDAGLKDFGDLLPEHGGIMDRVDSFVWSAPYSYLVCSYVIPALKNWSR